MKELHSKNGAVIPSLQGDISSFKCMLEAEERRLRNASVPCCKKSSPCKPYMPCRRTSCTPANQLSCWQASAPSSCPPVNLRPCPPPAIPNPCKPMQRSCVTRSAPVSWALPNPPFCPPTIGLSTRPQTCPVPQSLSNCLPPSRLSCAVSRPMTPICLPIARMSCPSPSPLSLCTAMHQSRCPSNPCPPANCSPLSARQCSATSVTYPKPCPIPEVPRFKHEQCMAMECCNDEPQKDCSDPPTRPLSSCKVGQGSNYFNSMLKELNKNNACSILPVSKPLMTACGKNTPTASWFGSRFRQWALCFQSWCHPQVC